MRAESNTVQPAHQESSPDSDADCVSVASTGSNSEGNVQALTLKNGKLESGKLKILHPKRRPKEVSVCRFDGEEGTIWVILPHLVGQ